MSADFDEIAEAISKAVNKRDRESASLSPSAAVAMLREAFAALNQKHVFQPGDIIRGKACVTKDSLRNWDKPHMVLEVYDTPRSVVISGKDTATAFMGNIHDMVIIAVHDRNNEVVNYLADSRYWEPYPDADKLKEDH